MHCPFCTAENTKVIDSRLSPEGYKVRRRRECNTCNKRFTTYESIEEFMPMIIKQDSRRENFDINKVKYGIIKAIEKRPISALQIDEMLAEIELKIKSSIEKEVPSSVIGEYIMEALKKIDQVAYVRFASVYRSFKDLTEFKKEIEKLIDKDDIK